MSGKAMSHKRCPATFRGWRCALADGHQVDRHKAGVGDLSIMWGWHEDSDYAEFHYEDAIDHLDSNGNTIYTEILT